MKKHAYLIIAHNQFNILKRLISALDYELNDIYIHIDKKVGNICENEFLQCACKSHVKFVKRISVTWGGDSQIKCEMNLLQEAFKEGYQYYHFLSGVDFPIKTQAEIHDFFDKHKGKEFIEYWDRNPKEYLYRTKYYYPLQEKIGRYTYDPKTLLLRVMSKLEVLFQILGQVNRNQLFEGDVKMGSQWVSISHEFVEYLFEQQHFIEMMFYNGIAVDELFMQTICWNSKFKKRIYRGDAIRNIDWKRGNPYTWKESDFDELKSSSALFIRKVSEDDQLLNRITNELLV